MDKATFEALYGTSGTVFPDNTTGDISEGDLRGFGQAIKDSFLSTSDNFIDEDSFASDSATKAPSQQSTKAYIASQLSGIVFDSDIKYFEQEEFLTGNTPNIKWISASSGAAANFTIATPGYGVNTTENAIGVAYQDTGTTSSGYNYIFRTSLVLATHQIKFRFRMALQNLSDGTDTYTIIIGLTDRTNLSTAAPDNAIVFRYTHSVNSGEFQAVTRAASVETATDTNVAAATTYKVFEISINQAANSVTFIVDGVTVATNTTNIPTGVELSLFSQILKSAGTTSRKMHFDWTELTLTRSTAR